jgi:phage shock protein E
MLTWLKKLFSGKTSPDFKGFIENGALIIDVRTTGEFSSGHLKNSVNIPLHNLKSSLKKFPDRNRVIITCCASGMRSASAKQILKAEGYLHVYNGGSWLNLKSKL